MITPPAPPSNDIQARLQRFAARAFILRPHLVTNVRPVVSFTFDDVPVSSFTHGARVLDDLGVRGTFYISGGLCRLGELGTGALPSLTTINPRECRSLHARGHEIGCHTYSHRHMQFCSRADVQDEIAANQAFFESMGAGIQLQNFAYPYNAPTITAKLRLQQHFLTCRGGIPGINAGLIDLGFLRGVELWSQTDAAEIRHWIDTAVRLNGWLVFFSHDISETPGKWGIAPALLEAAVVYARKRGCDVANVRDAARLVGAAKPAAATQS